MAEVEDVGVAEEEEGEDVASSRYSICDISRIFLVEYRTLNYHATSFSPLRKIMILTFSLSLIYNLYNFCLLLN